MSRLFKAFAVLALAQNGLKAEPVSNSSNVVSFETKPVSGNSSYPWEGCSNAGSTDYCVFNWTQNNGYPPVFNSTVVGYCYEDMSCCPDSSSKTQFNDCIWDGCDGQKDALHNSTAFCEQQESLKNMTMTECFVDKGCCQNITSNTSFIDCPHSFPDYAKFFIVEGVALIISLAAQGIIYQKKLNDLVKGLVWVAIGSSASGLTASTVAYFAKGASAVPVSSVSGLILGGAATGYWVYKKRKSAEQGACCPAPNSQIELAAGCCRIVCDCNFFRRAVQSRSSESKHLVGSVNNPNLYDGLIDPPIQKLDLVA